MGVDKDERCYLWMNDKGENASMVLGRSHEKRVATNLPYNVPSFRERG
jgi:hypothetical protein